jgi:1-deoxy-D-xylulose 5-phosphate reductoisomerase
MSFVIVATVAAVGTAVTAYGQYEAGKAQEAALKDQARQEKLRAQTEELARREELNRTLAANQVAMAMSGIAGATPQSVALESARKATSSEAAISLSEKLKQRQLIREGQAAKFAGTVGATGTLLAGAADAMSMTK